MNQEAMKKYCKNFALDIDSISLSSQKDRNASNSNDDGFPLMIDSATSLEAADINANNFFFTSFFETTKPSKFHFSSSAQRKIKDLNEDLSDNLEFYNNKKLIVKNPTTTTLSLSPYRKIKNLLNYEEFNFDSTTDEQEQANERIPRPPNAFILYRRANQSSVTRQYGKISNVEISRTLSKMWKNESEEVRLYWYKEAARKKMQHEMAHPNYVYQPKRVKGKLNIHLEMFGS